ncbi:tyrosine-protein phosphatase non-receptor type substrate 1-like isoform X2 [Petaurus breviceps papuanus]|uniref:tyrosine-protein phosphatase non-receptor type substrate 1-like isoform X2 n=1 Tax=Petaurus breviceps papuanus TaxID=3040969 RepID=UPI0036DA5062
MFSLSFWISVLPIVLICWAWVDTQDTSLVQPSGFVTATIGGSVILECRSKTNLPPGPVRWYKGTRPNRQLIFSDTGSYPRVQKVNNTNLVLDICINNITIQDEGVYYCIKFQKNPEKELSSGGGTLLIVGEHHSLSGGLVAAMVGSVCFILILFFLCCYFKRQKGSSPCLSRPGASKKNQSKKELLGSPANSNELSLR